MFNRSKLDARIRAFEQKIPFPDHEKERMKGRRNVLRYAPQNGVGVEIGVFRGHFSEIMCELLTPKKLYLIDPWTQLGETFGWGKEYTGFDTLRTADAKAEAIARVSRFPDTELVVIEDNFPRCKNQLAEPLDWAYLDAGHSYKNTIWELKNIAPLMHPEGTIMGDDFAWQPERAHHGVFQALCEFTAQSDWKLVYCGPAAQWALKRYPS